MPYNIPICLWIEPNYPQSVPLCYVKPTREMMVVKGKYVTSNGEIYLPYLKEWSVRTEAMSNICLCHIAAKNPEQHAG